MTRDETVLTRLPSYELDPLKAAAVRARCRAQLERQRRQRDRAAAAGEFAWRVIGPVVVGGVGLLYAAALIMTTVRLSLVLE